MSGLRLTVSAVLAAAGIVLGMVSPAVAASAAQNITILSAGPDTNGEPYNLTVAANDGNGVQISTMTAHVFSASMQDVADPTMTYASGPPANQVWVANPPIPESQLPAGAYTVTVDASDSTPETDNALPAPGSFSFTYVTSNLTVTPAPPSVTQGSQSVTFSGTLTGTAPGGTPVGIANAPVNLAGDNSNPVATTDSNGNFSYTATNVQPSNYTYSVPAGAGGTYPAASSTVSVGAEQAATSMTVSSSPASVTEGMQTVTFSGSVSVTPPPPATQTPVGIGKGVPIYLNGSTSPVTTTSDANGDFSYVATDVEPGNYTFSVAGTSLYTSASTAATVGSQPAPATIAITPSPAVVTFGSPSVAFSGSVTALPQGSTTAVPVPGTPIDVSIGGATASQVATTDSSGKFTYQATGITGTTDYMFSVPDSNLYSAQPDDVPVNLIQGKTALAVTASPPDPDLSAKSVTFTGTATVTPAGSTTADSMGSGVPVYLSVNGQPAAPIATTDANGGFSYTIPGPTDPAAYNFSIKAGTLYTTASDDVPIGPGEQSTLAVMPSTKTVTEGSQTVVFTGHLTGVAPGSSATNDIQNAPVWLSIGNRAATRVATTDVNGDFTYKVGGIRQTTVYTFSVAQTTNYTAATNAIPIGVSQARTRIRHIRVTPSHLKYGQNATLRATAQYLNGKQWTALPRTAVHLAEGKTKLKTVTTASNGAFAATLPSTHGPGWTATVNAGSLILQTSSMGNLSIALPLEFKSFSARLGVNDKITATGCLEVVAPVKDAGPGTVVEIQYSGNPRGPWRSLGKLALHNNVGRSRTCRSAVESYFSGTIHAKLANAYYRADFGATYSFQSAVSKVVHAWKYPTRIVSFTANKRTISKSGTVRFRGRLQAKVKSWRAFGGQKVTIIYNFKGTSIWNTLTTATTNSRGYFTADARGSKGNFVAINYAMYAGNATHLACMSQGIDVRISNGGPDVAAPSAGSGPVPSLAQLDRLPGSAAPMLTEYTAWPSIASLARSEP